MLVYVGASWRQKARLQTQDLLELGNFFPWSVLHDPGLLSYLAGGTFGPAQLPVL